MEENYLEPIWLQNELFISIIVKQKQDWRFSVPVDLHAAGMHSEKSCVWVYVGNKCAKYTFTWFVSIKVRSQNVS